MGMTPEMEAVRRQFEKWYEADAMPAESDWFTRDADDPDMYELDSVQHCWAAWQAALELVDLNINESVLKRDKYKCRHCNSRNNLHLHHVIYRSHGGEDSYDNLLTLCWLCHRAHHDGFLDIIVINVLPYDLEVKFWRRKGWKP